MASTIDYIEFVCEQISFDGEIRYKKMFGEYMVYVNNKPILLICNNTVFVKKLDCLEDIMKTAESGIPYKGSKEQYILDIEDRELCRKVIEMLEPITPIPKPRKKPVKLT